MLVDFIHPKDARWLGVLERVRHDVYHLPAYAEFAAKHEAGEPVAFYAQSGDRELLVPLLLRTLPPELDLPAGWRDAASPYGYPGPITTHPHESTWTQEAFTEFLHVGREYRLLTAFVRWHPLLGAPATPLPGVGELVHHGQVVYCDLTRGWEVMWSETNLNHRRNIRRMLQAGFTVEIDDWSSYHLFGSLYRTTMDRVNAAPFYYFSDQYLLDLRRMLTPHLHLFVVRTSAGALAAAGLFTHTDGIVEYHLSATPPEFRRSAPTKLLLHAARCWARQQGAAVFHLGGGTGAQAGSLFAFKAGFSRTLAPFHTLRMVFDKPLYGALDDGVAVHRSAFFPLYRDVLRDRPSGVAT